MNAGFIKESADGILLSIKLQPRSSANQIVGQHGELLKIKITAPPVDSAANEALVAFLAKRLDVPKGNIELVRGQTSRQKTILIRLMTAPQIIGKLGL